MTKFTIAEAPDGYDEPGLSRGDTVDGTLHRWLLKLVREHAAAGMVPTSCQFLWYELIAAGVVDKTQARNHPGSGGGRGVDQEVTEALTKLRELGLVPWAWIADETRQSFMYAGATTITDGLLDVLESITLDPWGEAGVPLILCESCSLAGVLRTTAQAYRCDIAATNGQVGGFLRTNVVRCCADAPKFLFRLHIEILSKSKRTRAEVRSRLISRGTAYEICGPSEAAAALGPKAQAAWPVDRATLK